MFEFIGRLVVWAVACGLALGLGAILWAYIQAAGGYLRAAHMAKASGVTLYKRDGPKPRLFALRMIHWQAWNARTWSFDGKDIPWTFVEPVREAEEFYPA